VAPSRFFPGEEEAWRRLRERGIDVDTWYLGLMVDLAGTKAVEIILEAEAIERTCLVCGVPIDGHPEKKYCSPRCRRAHQYIRNG
jgi:hypothetical protein